MWRLIRISALVSLLPLALLIWATSTAQFTFQHPRAPDVKVLVSDGGAKVAIPMGPLAVGTLKEPQPRTAPRLIAEKHRYDFGYMDPLSQGSHSFLVKNEGDAPLVLEILSTTCQCTVAGVSDNVIPAGSEGTVELKWTVPGHGRVFRQLATVRTNDPQHKTIAFTIEGLIRTSIGADREELAVQLDPDNSVTTEVTIFSQLWDEFSIASVDSGIEGLTWKQLPADKQDLEPLKAKSGRTLRLTIPSDLPASVADHVRLTIEPRGAEPETAKSASSEGRQLELPLHVTVRRRLSIYGPAIRSSGYIELGETHQGVPKQVRMQIKVRDREPSLPAVEFETTPAYLEAEITEHTDQRTGEIVPGLYDFVVKVPADAPPCSYLGDILGQVRIKTSHPRIPETALGVRFAVLPR